MLSRNYLLNGRYRIIRPLGRGGFGQVYEALDDKLDCIVAIKERHTERSAEKLRRAFEREAKLLANLRHPALPKVMDHFFEATGQFLVMEFIEGDDFSKLLAKRRGPFTAEEIYPWADSILKAIEYLHTRDDPIIHRDIKPANLKLTDRGEIYLLDFGLAKGAAGSMPEPAGGRSSSVHGYTQGYAPLEQEKDSGTDERSDVYALGATIYHLLTGQVPASASQRYRYLEINGRDLLPFASEVNPAVPFQVSQVLAQAMAVHRRDRLASAAQMRAGLIEAVIAPRTPIISLVDQTVTDHLSGTETDGRVVDSWPSQLDSEALDSPWLSTLRNQDSTLLDDEEESPTLKHTRERELEEAAQRESQRLENEARRIAEQEAEQAAEEWHAAGEARYKALSQAQLLADAERRRISAEARRKAEAEAERAGQRLRQEAEARRIAEQEAEARRIAEQEAEARRMAEQEAEARRIAEQEAEERRIAEEKAEARRIAEQEAEARRIAEQEAEARRIAEQEAEARRIAAQEAQARQARQAETLAEETAEREAAVAASRQIEAELSERLETEAGSRLLSEERLRSEAQNHQPEYIDPQITKFGATTIATLSDINEPTQAEYQQEADKPAVPTMAGSPGRKRRRLVIGSIAALLIASAVLAGSLALIHNFVSNRFAKETQTAGKQNSNSPLAPAAMASTPSGQPPYGKLILEKTLTDFPGRVASVVFSADGAMIAAAGDGDRIAVWDAPALKLKYLTHESNPNNQAIPSLAFSHDGQIIASGSIDRTVRLWKAADGSLIKSLSGHESDILSVAFSPDGKTLASAGKEVYLWDVATGKRIGPGFSGHTHEIYSIAFSPDGKTLAGAGSRNVAVQLWDVANRKRVRTLKAARATCLAFSPDGQTIAVGQMDGTITLWDSDPNHPRELPGHQGLVLSLAFNHDGTVLASGGRDKTIKLWELRTGLLRQTLTSTDNGHEDKVYSLSFFGQTLVSGSSDKRVKVWQQINAR